MTSIRYVGPPQHIVVGTGSTYRLPNSQLTTFARGGMSDVTPRIDVGLRIGVCLER